MWGFNTKEKPNQKKRSCPPSQQRILRPFLYTSAIRQEPIFQPTWETHILKMREKLDGLGMWLSWRDVRSGISPKFILANCVRNFYRVLRVSSYISIGNIGSCAMLTSYRGICAGNERFRYVALLAWCCQWSTRRFCVGHFYRVYNWVQSHAITIKCQRWDRGFRRHSYLQDACDT